LIYDKVVISGVITITHMRAKRYKRLPNIPSWLAITQHQVSEAIMEARLLLHHKSMAAQQCHTKILFLLKNIVLFLLKKKKTHLSRRGLSVSPYQCLFFAYNACRNSIY